MGLPTNGTGILANGTPGAGASQSFQALTISGDLARMSPRRGGVDVVRAIAPTAAQGVGGSARHGAGRALGRGVAVVVGRRARGRSRRGLD